MKKVEVLEAVLPSLKEDIGSGDITAALIDETVQSTAELVTREAAVICGIPFFEAVYQHVDSSIQIDWHVKEGEPIQPKQRLATLMGSARMIVTGERCALNWLQCLSGTATQVSEAVKRLAGTSTRLLDTRKTIPGLRAAQKYAVKVGGGYNHRQGLYDAYLIKENHIMSCGSIQKAIERARVLSPGKTIKVEVEVEDLSELQEALVAGADIVMLDNFNREAMEKAVARTAGQNQTQPDQKTRLEVSGNVTLSQLRDIAETGVDFVSMGSLTKHVRAVDLSMRVVMARA